MTDRQILTLLQKRDESALRALTAQYGGACKKLAMRILHSEQDAEEVWNDALLQVWSAVPPAAPKSYGAYLHTTVKRLSLNRAEQKQAKKRGGGQAEIPLHDLGRGREPAGDSIEQLMEERLLDEAVGRFLKTLPKMTVMIFVHYYGNDRSTREIAEAFGISQSRVTVTLMRTRKKLRKFLSEEGWL